MIFYHGSPNDNITELSIDYSNGKIYFTSSRLVALTYLPRAYPNMFRTDKNLEIYEEIVDGLFENATKGQSGYIYTIETDDFFELEQGPTCGHKHCFYSSKNAKILQKEKIEDVYQELLKYIKTGEFKIVKPDSDRKKEMIENILKDYQKMEKPLKRKRDLINLLK